MAAKKKKPEPVVEVPQPDVEFETPGSGEVRVRTNGWVTLAGAALVRFEKALRRARQS